MRMNVLSLLRCCLLLTLCLCVCRAWTTIWVTKSSSSFTSCANFASNKRTFTRICSLNPKDTTSDEDEDDGNNEEYLDDNTNNNNDDDDMTIKGARDLEQAIRNLAYPRRQSSSKVPQNPYVAYSVPDLDALVSSSSSSSPQQQPQQQQQRPSLFGAAVSYHVPFPEQQEELPDDDTFIVPGNTRTQTSMAETLRYKDYNNNTPTRPTVSTTTEATTTTEANSSSRMNTEQEEDEEEEVDGLYLDSDTYLDSARYINPDGSLNFPVETSPGRNQVLESLLAPPDMAPPTTTATAAANTNNNNQELTMEDLRWAVQQQANNANAASTANAQQQAQQQAQLQQQQLHEQVFENEQGFLQQSDLFKKGLTDPTAAIQALALRRSAQYRQDQQTDLDELDGKLQEMEDWLIAKKSTLLRDRDVANAVEEETRDKHMEKLTTRMEENDDNPWVDPDEQQNDERPIIIGKKSTVLSDRDVSKATEKNTKEMRMDSPGRDVSKATEKNTKERHLEKLAERGENDGNQWGTVLDPDGVVHFWNGMTGEAGSDGESNWALKKDPRTRNRLLRHKVSGEVYRF
jgi:hypothetical protein